MIHEERQGSMDLERAQTFTTHRDLSFGRPTTTTSNKASANTSGSTGWSFLSGWWITGSGRESHATSTTGRHTATSQAELTLRKSNLPRNSNGTTDEKDQEQQWEEGSIWDEETWHWPTLIARIFAFLLLALILVCIGLEEITKKFLVLAAIMCVVLAMCICATYVDIRKRCGCRKANVSGSASGTPVSESETTGKTVENPIVATSN